MRSRSCYPGTAWLVADVAVVILAVLGWILYPRASWAMIVVAVLVYGVQIAQQVRVERR